MSLTKETCRVSDEIAPLKRRKLHYPSESDDDRHYGEHRFRNVKRKQQSHQLDGILRSKDEKAGDKQGRVSSMESTGNRSRNRSTTPSSTNKERRVNASPKRHAGKPVTGTSHVDCHSSSSASSSGDRGHISRRSKHDRPQHSFRASRDQHDEPPSARSQQEYDSESTSYYGPSLRLGYAYAKSKVGRPQQPTKLIVSPSPPADSRPQHDLRRRLLVNGYSTETTGFTPYFLMYGREERVPDDIAYGTTPDDDDLQCRHVDYVAKRQDLLRLAFEMVREHLGVAAERRKTAYDPRTRPRTFKRRIFVWCYILRRRRNLNHKWQSFYDGPFLIVRELGEVNVEIQRTTRSRESVVHIDKLKPCLMEGRRSWLTGPAHRWQLTVRPLLHWNALRATASCRVRVQIQGLPLTHSETAVSVLSGPLVVYHRIQLSKTRTNSLTFLTKRIIRKPVRFRDAQT